MYKKCEEIINKLENEQKIKISDFEFPPKQELKLKLKDLLEDEVDEKYYLTNSQIEYLEYGKYNASKVSNKINQTDTGICPTLDTMQGGNRQPFIKINNATKKGYKEAYDGDSINLSYPNSKTRRGRVGEQVSQTLQCNDSMGIIEKNKYSEESLKRIKQNIIKNDIANTLTANAMQSFNHNNCALINSDLRIRKLTPKECWRLMGFDDEDFEKAQKVNSNTQLYKQAGNSIVVNVLEVILKNLLIEEVENGNNN